MTFDALLARAAQRLQRAGSPTPRLDAEVLLAHVIERERTWLFTWGDGECPTWQRARFEALVASRAEGRPVAYLTGEREFWGLALETSPHTLIPRPDTETLVAVALEKAPGGQGRMLDMGTGTGAIALAFASERPTWQVTGMDIKPEAVDLATRNATRLGITNARFQQSDWFAALESAATPLRFELIVSNPPYIAESDPHLAEGDVRFEPASALVAAADGMADLAHLVASARCHLVPGGWLALEHGHTQAASVRAALTAAGYDAVATRDDLGGNERVTLGQYVGA
ncbi:peptide chain release factor N(5)-glutamine methyltransferase [Halomonas dongshanensis]|uniref:Release factor glutamine methyltransferase n=1 Tax=Halomonas dongshanensis TaxID=2890835 RepID=A0ABT2EBI9_9GAMM|nr:peptide chain release factor N(5)-glutamine methyltransferase [Halomonas dongshanensis]MCS2608931.1 peptide chain release factor N(5)-glutamine methyltransferase [Halomonas dongshanensis]